jgi:hypothetical protein
MAAFPGRAGEVFCDFIHVYVTVIDFDQKLNRALQPDMQASHACGFDDDGIVQIPQAGIFEPAHQKSSADGTRL